MHNKRPVPSLTIPQLSNSVINYFYHFRRSLPRYVPNRAISGITFCLFAILLLTGHWLTSSPAIGGQNPKQNGLSYAEFDAAAYTPAAMDLILAEMVATGANWMTIVVHQYQYTPDATLIYPTVKTAIDDDLAYAIERAQALGLQVTLKPHVDIESDSAIWRGTIGLTFDEAAWDAWFAAYANFINHYADLASAAGADQLVIGTELAGTSSRESDWRTIIAGVRSRYGGPITYSANHSGEEQAINWWDGLDFIGISAYYPLTTGSNPSLSAMEQGWQPHVTDLRDLAARWDRSILFTEIGYRSSSGATNQPWCSDCNGSINLTEQPNAYRAFFSTVYNEPWLAGMAWWGWSVDPTKSGPCNNDYSPYNKAAENVLRGAFGAADKSIASTCDGPPPAPTPFSTTPTPAPDVPSAANSPGFAIVEDFEALSAGLAYTQNGWHGLGLVTVAVDPLDGDNQTLRLQGENALASRSLPNAIIASSTMPTGTLHYRLLRNGPMDASTGASDEAMPTQFSSFEAQFAVQLAAPNEFRSRDGDQFVSLSGRDNNGAAVDATFAENVWYCVWLVPNAATSRVEIYVRGGDLAEVTKLNAPEQSDFGFRNGGVDALRTFYSRTGFDEGSALYVDDIYVDAISVNLSSPIESCRDEGVEPPVINEVVRIFIPLIP